MNNFIKILEWVEQNQICVKPFCTTCGAQEYRSEIHNQMDKDKKNFIEDLSNLDLIELQNYPDWDQAIHTCLLEIRNVSLMDRILRSWLLNIDKNIILADIVLFYFVRCGVIFAPMSVETLNKWQETCISLAIKTKNESLIESLIYTLGTRIKENQELWSVIQEQSNMSRKIYLALQRI